MTNALNVPGQGFIGLLSKNSPPRRVCGSSASSPRRSDLPDWSPACLLSVEFSSSLVGYDPLVLPADPLAIDQLLG
jgi:hypothetical protein